MHLEQQELTPFHLGGGVVEPSGCVELGVEEERAPLAPAEQVVGVLEALTRGPRRALVHAGDIDDAAGLLVLGDEVRAGDGGIDQRRVEAGDDSCRLIGDAVAIHAPWSDRARRMSATSSLFGHIRLSQGERSPLATLAAALL